MKQYKDQQGMTILMVLGLMILATIVSTIVYQVTVQSDRESLSSKQYKQVKVALSSGERATRSYIQYHPMDFMGVVNQFYQINITSPSGSGKLEPIKLPLNSMVSNSDAMKEGFDAYLTGVNFNPTTIGVDLQAKVQIHAYQKRDTTKVAEVIQNFIFDVSGVKIDSTVIMTNPVSSCGPEMAFWAGTGVGNGNLNISLNVTNGGAYFGDNFSLNGGSSTTFEGDLIFGGVTTPTTPGTVNNPITVRGNLYSTQPFDMNGSAGAHTIEGDMVLMAGWASSGITADLDVGGDLYITGGTASNFSMNSGYDISVGGNLETDYGVSGDGRLSVDGTAWIKGDHSGPITVEGNALIEGDMNLTSWSNTSYFRDSLQVYGDYSSNMNNTVTNGLWADNHATTRPVSQGTATGLGRDIFVFPASRLDTITDKLSSNNEVLISFGVDEDTVDTYKVSWNTLRESMYSIGDVAYQTLCPDSLYKQSGDPQVCRQFSGPSAQIMWANTTLRSTHAREGYFYLDLDIPPYTTHSTQPFTSTNSSTSPVTGNWVITKTTGLIEMIHSSNTSFPEVDPSGRILFWLRDDAELKNFRVGGSGDFYGVVLHEGKKWDNGDDVGTTHVHGAFYLNTRESATMNGGSGVLSITMDTTVFNDLIKSGMTKLDSNGNSVGLCSEGTGASQSYSQGYTLASEQLKVRTRASYRAGSDALDVTSGGTSYLAPENNALPFLALSRYSVTIDPLEYPTFQSILDTFHIEPIASYQGRIYVGDDVRNVCGGGSWGGDTYVTALDSLFTKTYTMTCQGESISKNFYIDQSSQHYIADETGTSSIATSSTTTSSAGQTSSVTASSIAEVSSSSVTIDTNVTQSTAGYICDTLALDLFSLQLSVSASYDETPYPYQVGRKGRTSGVSAAETFMKLDLSNVIGNIINSRFIVDFHSTMGSNWTANGPYELAVVEQNVVSPTWTNSNVYSDFGTKDWTANTTLASLMVDSSEFGDTPLNSISTHLDDWLTARAGDSDNEGWVMYLNTGDNNYRGKKVSGAQLAFCASGSINGVGVSSSAEASSSSSSIPEYTVNFETIPASKGNFTNNGSTVDSNEYLNTTLTVNSGYILDEWQDDLNNNSTSRSVRVESDTTIYAILQIPAGDCSSSPDYASSGTNYYLGQTVIYNNELFRCLEYGSCDGVQPDSDGSIWEDKATTCVSLPACEPAWVSNYNNGSGYQGGNKVSKGGKNYEACSWSNGTDPVTGGKTTTGSCTWEYSWKDIGECN